MTNTIQINSSELSRIDNSINDEIIVVLPFIDKDIIEKTIDVMNRRAMCNYTLISVYDDIRLGFIQVANFVYSKTKSTYFGYTAQDAFPGEGWLKCALDILKKTNGNLLAFNDGRFYGNIAVFGIARRTWVNSLYHKFLFYPGYKSHFGDTELSVLAMHDRKLVFSPNCLLVEVDYEKHLHGNNEEDDSLYRQRARTGFGNLMPPFEPA